MKVLFATAEARPFAVTGGLGDVSASLPRALRARLVGCRVVMPLYECISAELRKDMKFLTSFSVPVSWRRQYCGVFEAKVNGVIYYLLDNQYYFKREGLYGHYDDAERFAFFSRAVLEMLKYIDFKPDVIHANDWQSALIPVYHTLFYGQEEPYSSIRTLYTIHNIQYQGVYGMEILGDVFGLPDEAREIVQHGDCIDLMKAGIETANRVSTVSPTYAQELLDPWFSHGMDAILQLRSWKLSGILNGIDTDTYDPATDPYLFAPYSAEDMAGKAINKRSLQERLGLPIRDDVPLIGMVSRLASHKGFDLVQCVFEQLMQEDVQVVILGSGEWSYETFFRSMYEKYPEKFCFCSGFVPELAQKIYAASDLFLMPSKSEPCGLSQMVACRYGAIPIVRETGGLKDSIQDCGDGNGNGFTFKTYNAHDMLDAICRGIRVYRNTEEWKQLTERAMRCDFSWGRSANEYIRLYKLLKNG